MVDNDDHVWRGVYDDRRFGRQVCAYVRKVTRMGKNNEGVAKVRRYQ